MIRTDNMPMKALVFAFFLLPTICEGFKLTYHAQTSTPSTNRNPRQACGVLECSEELSESSNDSKRLVGLTIYMRDGMRNGKWKLLTTLVERSPEVEISSDEKRIIGQLTTKKGEVMVELHEKDECESLSTQYSCIALLIDSRGRTTLMKALLGGNIGSDLDPSCECEGSELSQDSSNHPLAAKESEAVERVEHPTKSMWEKLKCIEKRLEDFQTNYNRLDDKVESLGTTVVDKIHDLERTISDKLMASEMRTDDNMVKLKERLEDKISETSMGESKVIPSVQISDNVCYNNTLLLGQVIDSVQFIVDSLPTISHHFNNLETAIIDSVSKVAAIDSKMVGLITGVDSTSQITNRLVKDVDSLSKPCVQKTPAQVDEYFDPLRTGRKEWRLAFRGTAYNNIEVYPAYIHGTGIPAEVEAGCKQFNHSLPCVNHYRNRDALENWTNVHEVLFAIYDKGQMVKRIIFNGRYSTFTSWFSGNRVLQSSWNDLKTLSHNIFNMEGDTRTELLRRFFVNHLYNGCPKDQGWFFAGDAVPGVCPYEVKLARPMFLYSKNSGVALLSSPQQVAKADSIGVYIKYRG